jgi:DNA-binding CsgD family transcriptional regulator
MIKDTSYVRGDLVNMTTLSRKYTDLYYPGGGPNSDPVLEHVSADSGPFYVGLEKLFMEKNTKFSGNKFYAALFENGCEYFAAYPFKDDAGIGFGVFTIFATAEQMNSERPPKYFQNLAFEFHNILKSNGQLANHFNLLDREKFVLAKMADGKTAADIAQELGITVRSIELRLQSARKKLQARTTTEAVYKAVAYSILPFYPR